MGSRLNDCCVAGGGQGVLEQAERQLEGRALRPGVRQRACGNEACVPCRAVLGNALLRFKIHSYNAKALRVAFGQFVVVQQGPYKVARNPRAILQRAMFDSWPIGYLAERQRGSIAIFLKQLF